MNAAVVTVGAATVVTVTPSAVDRVAVFPFVSVLVAVCAVAWSENCTVKPTLTLEPVIVSRVTSSQVTPNSVAIAQRKVRCAAASKSERSPEKVRLPPTRILYSPPGVSGGGEGGGGDGGGGEGGGEGGGGEGWPTTSIVLLKEHRPSSHSPRVSVALKVESASKM